MSNVIEILKNYYKPVYEAKRSRDFFFSLADYVNYIKKTPETNKIIEIITKDKNAILKERDDYETKSLQELEVSKKELLKIVKDSELSDSELNQEINELKLYEKGDVQSSLVESDAIARYLWEIARILFQKGHKESLKKFIDERPNTPNVYLDLKNFVFSKTLGKRHEIDRRITELREIKLWGCWDYLSLVPIILLDRKEFPEVVSKRDLGMANIYIEIWEIIKIRIAVRNEINSISPQIPPEEAREMSKYKLYASKIHNHLLEELDLQKAKEEPLEVIRAIEPYSYNVIPDRTIDIRKEMEESQRWMAEREQRDRQHRELMKQNRMLASRIDKYSHALNLIIERAEFTGEGNSFNIDYYYFNFEDRMVDSKMLEKFLIELQNNGCFEKYGRANYTGGTKFSFIKTDVKKLKEFKEKRGLKDVLPNEEKQTKEKMKTPKTFEVKVKDRYIWINDYLLSKPHAVGVNFEFLERIQEKKPNTEIKRGEFPQSFQEEIKNRTFFQILNALGFKGEIKKAFFYKVDENSLFFRGNKITNKDLEEIGIKTQVFLKELELAHTRNNPE